MTTTMRVTPGPGGNDGSMPAPDGRGTDRPSPGPPHEPHESPGIHSENFKFPTGFLWGAATAAHQVEGNCVDNDWWAWEQSGKVAEPSGAACDHFNRFREDFDLARELHHTAQRFSLEWSRIEPQEGRFNEEGLRHYREVIEAVRERGMEPVVTIFHCTLPLWLAEKGGLEHPEFERYFGRFVARIVEEYGDLIRWWITFNEPVVQVFKGWIIGQWPPGKINDFPGALKAMRHLLRAHVKAYHAIHERRPDAMVSVAKHALALTPCNKRRRLDRLSVGVRTYLFNHLFLDALHTGALRVPGFFWERLPQAHTIDYIGLILITENGLPAERDDDRWTFLYLHLWQVARAIADGIPVVGYLHWSLLDNYEWADGYGARFGLLAVDYATQRRTIRESARRMAEIVARNEL